MLERLQKIIAHAGIASRRHAEQLILSGQVLVNGKVVRELGCKADPAVDKIEAAGRLVEEKRRHVYLIMHKPPEVVSSLADPEGRKTLRNFLRGFPERVYPVGNLDYAASGLIFLTNDGDLTAAILRSWSNLPQLYHIKIKGRLMLEQLDSLSRQTNTIVRVIRQPDSTRGHAANFWYEALVTGSKLDLLDRTLQKNLHPLEKVKRVGLGPLSLEGIPVGHYVVISKAQAEALRHPTRPVVFTPHPKSPSIGAALRRPAADSQPHRYPHAQGKTQYFSAPGSKQKERPKRYTKLQRRPATPPIAREKSDELDSDDERLDSLEAPRAPWLNATRPSNAPAKPAGKFHADRSFQNRASRDDRPSSGSTKFSRPGLANNKFNRPTNAPAKPSGKFRGDRNSRPASSRPRGPRKFPPRRPR